MTSPNKAFSHNRRESPDNSSSSSNSVAPSHAGSASKGSSGGRSLTSRATPPAGQYVSPYPPLEQTSTSSSATRSIHTTTAGTQLRPLGVQAPSSAAMTAVSQEEFEAQKRLMISALNDHRINTVGELRRVERIFASLGSSDITQPMTAAWVYYVNSNNLLVELRSLTRDYPFSSDCLDEGKRRVHQDPASNRSWNYCWLVLAKIHTDRLIPAYARAQASRAEMWAGRRPSDEAVERLADAFTREWTNALAQILRYWESPPIIR